MLTEHCHCFSCPVCNHNLDEVGDAVEQEEHVRQCLEGGPGQDLPTSRYLVYRLPAESALLGVECKLFYLLMVYITAF